MWEKEQLLSPETRSDTSKIRYIKKFFGIVLYEIFITHMLELASLKVPGTFTEG